MNGNGANIVKDIEIGGSPAPRSAIAAIDRKKINEWRDKWVEELPGAAVIEFDEIVP